MRSKAALAAIRFCSNSKQHVSESSLLRATKTCRMVFWPSGRVQPELILERQVEYKSYVQGILPQVKILLEQFRKAGLQRENMSFHDMFCFFGHPCGGSKVHDRLHSPANGVLTMRLKCRAHEPSAK